MFECLIGFVKFINPAAKCRNPYVAKVVLFDIADKIIA
jgi:hypothetical protein